MTGLRLLISERAKEEIGRANAWWQRERPSARIGLTDELRQAFDIVVQHPLAGLRIDDPEFRTVRRLSLNRTHYHLFYEIRDDAVVILGIRHQSRQPTA